MVIVALGELSHSVCKIACFNPTCVTPVVQGSELVITFCGGNCGIVLSVLTDRGHVQVVLGLLLHVHVRLAPRVVLEDHLAGRVSVKQDNKVAFVKYYRGRSWS